MDWRHIGARSVERDDRVGRHGFGLEEFHSHADPTALQPSDQAWAAFFAADGQALGKAEAAQLLDFVRVSIHRIHFPDDASSRGVRYATHTGHVHGNSPAPVLPRVGRACNRRYRPHKQEV
jgi:hypothetical protein